MCANTWDGAVVTEDTTALFACFVLRVFNPEARLANPVPTARLLTYFGLAFWGLVTFSWQPPMPIGGCGGMVQRLRVWGPTHTVTMRRNKTHSSRC